MTPRKEEYTYIRKLEWRETNLSRLCEWLGDVSSEINWKYVSSDNFCYLVHFPECKIVYKVKNNKKRFTAKLQFIYYKN
jgi:hypothetical protein